MKHGEFFIKVHQFPGSVFPFAQFAQAVKNIEQEPYARPGVVKCHVFHV